MIILDNLGFKLLDLDWRLLLLLLSVEPFCFFMLDADAIGDKCICIDLYVIGGFILSDLM